jgi:hypothetical protein
MEAGMIRDKLRRVSMPWSRSKTPPLRWMICGFDIPGGNGRVRVYASRSFPAGMEFGQAEMDGHSASLWYIEAAMDNLLVINADSYQEALEQIYARWAREDALERLGIPQAAPEIRA